MINKGQIVEIPASSLLYEKKTPDSQSKREELGWRSYPKNYSLFDGFLVGEHSGYKNFKIGQRKGINVGGKKAPLYVIGINESDNRIFVGAGESHPGLWARTLCFSKAKIRWLEDFNLNYSQLQDGVSVDILVSIIDGKKPAILYVFGEEVFIELEEPISIIIENYPINIMRHDKTIANIKTV